MGVITERERQKYFAYLDGVADGLNESRNDVNSVLDKIRAEIIRERDGDMGGSQEIINGFIYGCNRSLDIIDKYREEQE